MSTSCGSPCYAAPELVVSEGLYVGSAVDIWSCGVILYAMLSGYLPYDDDPNNPEGDNINLLYKYIMSTKLNFPDQMSPEARHLLQMMLVPNPELRCSVTDIMEHPWLAGYRDLFLRTPEDNEYIFQDHMYRKSQGAKRELAERRRVQEEGKMYKAMQRSQSTMPGAGTSSILEYNRRAREGRHQSAMPGLSGSGTMPEYLASAGHRTPPLSASFREPISVSAPLPPPLPTAVPPVSEGLPISSLPAQSQAPFADVQELSSDIPTAPPLVATGSNAPSNMAVENEVTDAARPTTPTRVDEGERKTPMSANKNRHTIQVEYDVNASYEMQQGSLPSRESPEGSVAALEQGMMDLQPSPSQADVDMESNSSHGLQGPAQSGPLLAELSGMPSPLVDSTQEQNPGPPAQPATPSKSRAAASEVVGSPSTPRASTAPPNEDILTPRQKVSDATPRASVQLAPPIGKAYESMPPSMAASSASAPRLNPIGLPLPPIQQAKPDRSRKGMSLDKFGLAKLLGQTPQEDKKSQPPSSFKSGHVKRSSVSRPQTADQDKTDKKSRRRTLQLMGR